MVDRYRREYDPSNYGQQIGKGLEGIGFFLAALAELKKAKLTKDVAPIRDYSESYGELPPDLTEEQIKSYETVHGKFPRKPVYEEPKTEDLGEGRYRTSISPKTSERPFGGVSDLIRYLLLPKKEGVEYVTPSVGSQRKAMSWPTMPSLVRTPVTERNIPAPSPKQLEAQSLRGVPKGDLLKAIRAKLGLELSPAAEERLSLSQEFSFKILEQKQQFQEETLKQRIQNVDEMYNRKLIDKEARDKWKEDFTLQRDKEKEEAKKELENLRQSHREELQKIKESKPEGPAQWEPRISKLRDDTRAKTLAEMAPYMQWKMVADPTAPGGMSMRPQPSLPAEEYLKKYKEAYRRIWRSNIKAYKRDNFLPSSISEDVPEEEFTEAVKSIGVFGEGEGLPLGKEQQKGKFIIKKKNF